MNHTLPLHSTAQRGLAKIGWLILLVLIAGAGAALWLVNWTEKPVHTGDQALVFEVKKGASMRQVATQLSTQTGYRHPRLLSLYAQYLQLAGSIRTGEYAIPVNATPREFLSVLVNGKVISYPLTIIEGWTFAQMYEAVSTHAALTHTLNSANEVMAKLGKPQEHPEGRFYPDTYLVTKGLSDIDVFRQSYAKMAKELDLAWANRQSDLPLKSPYDALILASIIERETGAPEEREEISGVLIRRLQKGMRLQTDPTVIYGVGDAYDGDITRAHLQKDTPYNTYTRGGLTPTPIALPGRGSLTAAVNPATGDSLYFVATGEGDGRHYFSTTLAEHNRALRRYLARLKQNRP